MAAFIASLLSIISRAVRGQVVGQTHFSTQGLSIPLPAVPHVVIPDDVVERFEEVVVIGDVHGCFQELKQLLSIIHEDGPSRSSASAVPSTASKVLKIFVGDLVNKGPENRQVIQFLLHNKERHSYISVRGNHDDVVVDQVLNVVRKDKENLRPKNKWMLDVTEEEIRFLMELPYSITIPSLNAIVVHAGIIPGTPVEDMSPTNLVSMRNLIKDGEIYRASKSHKEGIAWAKCWPGPHNVYFGHDAKRMLQKEAHAIGLDTGCVYGKELTGYFLKGRRKGQFISVKAEKVYQETGK